MNLFRRNAQPIPGLVLRVLTTVVVVPPIFAVIWFGDPWFTMVVGAIAIAALHELYFLISKRWTRPFLLLGTFWTTAFLINSLFGGTKTMPIVAGAAVILSLPILPLRRRWREDLVPWAWTIAGAFLLGWTLSHLLLLRQLASGREWVLFTLFTIFAADASAYFVGKALGRHKLAPRISPKKTWEGAIGGMAGALLIGLLIHYSLGLPVETAQVLGIAATIAVASTLGDLSESYLKRWVGAKEAGSWVPGHGGLLDRLDSVVLTVVVVYYYVRWITE
ncbi:MAG: phosphatidate cytidylyltransferase [Chloroflexi bacterium]|nr:phosphatidate cytidylyltransferase [Chloroflexota bacterium]